jgi:hypothetical protein
LARSADFQVVEVGGKIARRRANCPSSIQERGEELRRRGWKKEGLPDLRKADKVKVPPARRLRRETTMSLEWIAGRLHMGNWTCISHLLHEERRH